MKESKTVIESFNYNYFLPIITAPFFIFSVYIGPLAFPILFLFSAPLFLSSIMFLWRMTIYEDGLHIKYFISLGRNRYVKWSEIKNAELFTQKQRHAELEELRITLTNDKALKFFRLGIKNYALLSQIVVEQFENQRGYKTAKPHQPKRWDFKR